MSHESYGVREARAEGDGLDVHIQEIQTLGYTTLEAGATAAQLSHLRESLDLICQRQTAESGGSEAMRKIGEEGTARALLAYDDAFLAIANHPGPVEICRRLLGDYFVLMQQNGIVNRPADQLRHRQTAYHRDLPYQHFVSSRPLAISALFCLDAFEDSNGPTVVVPGSHKIEALPSEGYLRKMERPVLAPAGSFIVFDSMLFHRSGINRSSAPRRAVNNVYVLPILKQQIVLSALLDGKWAKDPWLRRLLGYDSDPPRSLAEFRARLGQRGDATGARE